MQDALFDLGESPTASTWVYVIGPENSPVVKIGKATDIPDRLSGIQTGNPEPLIIRWAVAGGRALEKALHAEFKSLRKMGEWFDFGTLDPVEEVAAAVERLLSGQMLIVYGSNQAVQYSRYPAESDPDRKNPQYQPNEYGCRRLTPTERIVSGHAPSSCAYWCRCFAMICPCVD